MYNDKIMDHFKNPRNVGRLDHADGVGEAGNAEKGDVMRMHLTINNGIITAAMHQTFGSAVAIAVSSIASEMILGKSVDVAYQISRDEVSDALDSIPPDKMDCSNMAPAAIKAAIDDYRSRQ